MTKARRQMMFLGLVAAFFALVLLVLLTAAPKSSRQSMREEMVEMAELAELIKAANENKSKLEKEACVPTVVSEELLWPRAAGENELIEDRVSCAGASPLLGARCHHFLFSKGEAPWTRADLLGDPAYLDSFLAHYASGGHELRANAGGQRLSHLFAVWSIARRFRPRFVIESGKFRGWGLFNLRRALGPDIKLFSIDPVDRNNTYVDDNANTHYFGGSKPAGTRARFSDFADIADIDWAALGVVPEHTLVVLDDHASVPRRINELAPRGFRRFYIDDNAPRPAGDSLCPKYLADVRPPTGENGWRVPIYDDFGKLQTRVTYPALLRMADAFFAAVRTYYEFPPLVLHDGFFRERARDFSTSSAQEIWEMTAEPLLPFDDRRVRDLDLTYEESNYYYCAYLELL